MITCLQSLKEGQNAAFQSQLSSCVDHRLCSGHHPAERALPHEKDGDQQAVQHC